MKGLFRIIGRYSLTAGMITIIVLASNVGAFIFWGSRAVKSEGIQDYGRQAMEEVAEEASVRNDFLTMSAAGIKRLEDSNFKWAMALDGEGKVSWSWKLPETIPDSYGIKEAASFSRWYLEDYPVRVWTKGNFLFVFGCDPDKVARYDMILSVTLIEGLPFYVKLMIGINLVVIILFILVFGYRFYCAMRPVAQGIEQLARGERAELEEKGLTRELAGKLNHVSEILSAQRKKLSERDRARTEWVAGISHDIRTPLALIMGHSDKLADTSGLSEENHRRAENIRTQSIIIRGLIADLNLISKLAYQAQPLNECICAPASILRECAAEFYNESLSEASLYSIKIQAEEETERIKVKADEKLLKRALRNLIGNSIRHNPEGCHVEVFLYRKDEEICWKVEDTGEGIPETIVQNIDSQDWKMHIMGLRLTAQIARAHGGQLRFRKRKNGNYDAEFGIKFQ